MKTDRRSQKTIAAIQGTVLHLMCTRRMNEIKIVDLCMAADINRTTFYLHYRNIAEVLKSLIDDMAAQIFDSEAEAGAELGSSKSGRTLEFLIACAETLDRYENFGPFVQKSPDADYFLTSLKNVLADKIYGYMARKYGTEAGDAKVIIRFLTGGVLDVYVEWLKSDKSVPLGTVLHVCAPMVSAGYELLDKIAGGDSQQF